MKVVVTGGNGFVGSHLVDKLVSMGDDVHVIDNLCANNEKFYYNDDASYYPCSILDLYRTAQIIDGADVVFHLAAESRIGPSIENPSRTVDVNVQGTCHILEVARKYKVNRVVYSSTSACYGLKNQPPFTEDMPRDCLNPYAVTKLSAEDLCCMYTSLYGLNTISLRYFNIYGDRAPTTGQYAPIVGLLLKQYRDGMPMTIVGDGLQRRDFIHVDDVVSANIAASKTAVGFGEMYNIGTGVNYSILEIAQAIGGRYEFIPYRPGEARNTLADISKAKKMLSWEPSVSFLNWLEKELCS